MDARALRCLLAAATLAVVLPGHAEVTPVRDQSCQLPATDEDPLANRAAILSRYERLPAACLEQIFSTCSQESSRGLLDFGSAAVCSFGYEALLSQRFGGSFRALMVWWHTRRADVLQ